jgi:hypothetical protein
MRTPAKTVPGGRCNAVLLMLLLWAVKGAGIGAIAGVVLYFVRRAVTDRYPPLRRALDKYWPIHADGGGPSVPSRKFWATLETLAIIGALCGLGWGLGDIEESLR